MLSLLCLFSGRRFRRFDAHHAGMRLSGLRTILADGSQPPVSERAEATLSAKETDGAGLFCGSIFGNQILFVEQSNPAVSIRIDLNQGKKLWVEERII